MPNSDLFNGNTSETDEEEPTSYLETLVGEGKKFKDAEGLAKGKAEADRFVLQLQDQLSALREDLNKNKTVEEMVELIMQKTAATPTPTPASNQNNSDQNAAGNALTADEINAIVQSKLQEADTHSKKKANVDYCHQEMQKLHGANYRKVLSEKVGKLGGDPNFYAKIAEDNPAAFLALFGSTIPAPASLPGAPRSTFRAPVNTPGAGVKNQAYYSNLRKTDPKTYYKPDTQIEMHKTAIAMGDAFFQ